ncbi:MAG: hypothetical protein KDB00_08680, partial [Planctomycetales bacterium]|nr:hypothetical protein [Planctomycetales bacterium]
MSVDSSDCEGVDSSSDELHDSNTKKWFSNSEFSVTTMAGDLDSRMTELTPIREEATGDAGDAAAPGQFLGDFSLIQEIGR